MKHRIAGLTSLPRISPVPRSLCAATFTRKKPVLVQHNGASIRLLQLRAFSMSTQNRAEAPKFDRYSNTNARPASELNNDITQEEKDHFAKRLNEDKGKQIRTPWHREGSDLPPVSRQRSAGAMTKGKFIG